MRELDDIINKYFSIDTNVSVYSKDAFDIEIELNKLIHNMIPYEKPDILSFYDNKIVGIEHFEFDNYKNNKKGSDFKVKDNEISKKFDNYVAKELKEKKMVTLTDTIASTSTLGNYYDNFQNSFLNHYNKIDNYIENIKNNYDVPNKKMEIWFFAEDVSPLGSYYMNKEGDIKLLHPFLNIEMIKLLENSPKLIGIILGTYAGNNYKVFVIYNSEEAIEKLKKDVLNLTEKDFFSFEPHTTGYAIKIPNE